MVLPCNVWSVLAVEIVSDVFEGLSRVKRQQLVYKALNERIESGEIHAVSMRTYSPEEAKGCP